jgi:hypothetical protein
MSIPSSISAMVVRKSIMSGQVGCLQGLAPRRNSAWGLVSSATHIKRQTNTEESTTRVGQE